MANHMEYQAVMKRAWAIFRTTYRYPAIPFASIGRRCFAWALRKAWAAAREAAEVAAIPVETRTTRIADLEIERDRLIFADSFRWATSRRQQIDAEIQRLAA